MSLLTAALLILVVNLWVQPLAYRTMRAELFRIHAICQWCVASACVMTALMVVSVVRVLRT